MVDITDKELKQFGVRGAHRQRMVNSLLGVRAKRRQSMNLEGKPVKRSSPTELSTRILSSNEQCAASSATAQELLSIGVSG